MKNLRLMSGWFVFLLLACSGLVSCLGLRAALDDDGETNLPFEAIVATDAHSPESLPLPPEPTTTDATGADDAPREEAGDTPGCIPKTCAQLGATCGSVLDGCGMMRQCGTCTAPQTCGGSGTPNTCGEGSCTPKTCAQLGATCGSVSDGCGKTLSCGTCTAPQTCGGDGTPNTCGCTPKTCAQLGATCGSVSDGCGKTLSCGTCTTPQTCGGGGKANTCGEGPCTPKTCAQLGATCGSVSDGCGKTLSCGTCTPPQTCGGGGKANTCGCKAKTCAQLGATCGSVSDGCGKTLSCGTCTAPQTCGGGGKANTCGCTPKTCAQLGATCGSVSDGCGKTLNCGTCTAPKTCGGDGTPNVCGAPSCPTFAQRLSTKDITPGVNVRTNVPIMVNVLPTNQIRVAWADAAGKIHITPLKVDGSSAGNDVTLPGSSVHGFVSHSDGDALLVRRSDAMVLVRTDAAGKERFAKVLVGQNNHTTAGDKWVDSWGHRGRLAWSGQKYAAYFGHTQMFGGTSGKHQGDILLYLDANGNKLSGGWSWGCSHSIDVRLSYDGNIFGPVCASDCYPQKAIMFNHRTLLRKESGNCAGSVSAQLGGLVPIDKDGFFLAFASKFDDSGKTQTNNQIGVIRITAAGKLGHVKWVTNSTSVAKGSPQMAAYGKNFLIGWLEGTTTKLALIDVQAKILQGPISPSAPLSRYADRGDFANLPNGDVIWVSAPSTQKLTYVRMRYCP